MVLPTAALNILPAFDCLRIPTHQPSVDCSVCLQAPSGRLAPTATAPISCWTTRCPPRWTSHCWRLCASRLCRQAHQWGGAGGGVGGGGACATRRADSGALRVVHQARRRKFQGRLCSGPHAHGIVRLPLASRPAACCHNIISLPRRACFRSGAPCADSLNQSFRTPSASPVRHAWCLHLCRAGLPVGRA